jgi:hypothetical protein
VAARRDDLVELPGCDQEFADRSSGRRLHDGSAISNVDAPTLFVHSAVMTPA